MFILLFALVIGGIHNLKCRNKHLAARILRKASTLTSIPLSHSITSLLICKMLKVQIRFSFQLLMKMNNYLLCHASLSEWTAHKVNMKSKLTLVLLWTIYQCMLFQRKQIFVFMIFLLIHSLRCFPYHQTLWFFNPSHPATELFFNIKGVIWCDFKFFFLFGVLQAVCA